MAAADTHDAVISTKAKIKLLIADDVSVKDVHVDTRDGRVVLHGKVATEGEKERAEVDNGVVLLEGKTPTHRDELAAIEHAHMVPGVRRVASEIKVESEES